MSASTPTTHRVLHFVRLLIPLTFTLPPFLISFFTFSAPQPTTTATPRKGMHKFISRLLNRLSVLPLTLPLCLVLVLGVGNVLGQINMSSTSSHTQNFNGLASSGTGNAWTDNLTIGNWYSQRSGTGTTYDAGTGSVNGGNLYSFGATSNSDRALGTIGSGNAAAGSFAHGVLLRNTSGSAITDIKVSYTLEQWRNGGNTTANTITFWYKISSSTVTALNPNSNSGWTQVAGLSLSSPINTSTGAALDGNASANKVSATNVSIPSLSLANNDYIMLKWEDPDHSGPDHGLAIDDVTISWTVAATAPANDICSNATSLACGASNINGTTVNSTSKTPPGSAFTSNFGVWYTFTGDGQATTISSTAGAGFDHKIAVLSGSACSGFTLLQSSDLEAENGTESVSIPTTNGTIYYVWVAHFNPAGNSADAGTFTISRTCFVGDYRTKQNGNWGTYTTWEKWSGSAWVACSSGDFPDASTANVFVLHTVDVNGSGTPPWNVNNLTVQSGGKLWCNSFSGNNYYIQVYGDIVCDGTIGSVSGDDISFDIAGGATCTISGTGTFTASRLRKDNALNNSSNTTVVVDMNINLTWSTASGTVMYNDAGASSNFDVTVNSGKTIKCYGPGSVACNLAIDGTNGGDSSPLGGTYTVYGTIDIDGAYYSLNNNTAASGRATSLSIKNGGTVKCRYIQTGSSGTAGNTLRIENGGKLIIFGSVDTITASLNNTTWNNYSATNNTWDFQSGSTIEYSGATQQKVNGITTCSNFIVSGGGLKKLGNDFTVSGVLTLTNGRVQTDAYKVIHTSTAAADLIHTSGSSSFIFGTYRRYVASNTSAYELPVGLGSITSNYRRADLVNNNLSGVTYVDASVRSITESGNNIDSRITCIQEGSTLTDVGGNTVWSLVPNGSPSGGSYGVRLYVNGTGLTTADDNTFCAVKRNDGSTDYADWNTFFASTTIPSNGAAGRIYNNGNGYAERLGYTSFSEHAIGKTPSNQPLPVGLVSFDVNCQESGNVLLEWSTASESNSSHFVVESSTDGNHWMVAGVIDATGFSQELLTYQFTHRAEMGLTYYRLIQVDKDNQQTEFPAVSTICNVQEKELITLPNPSGNDFMLIYTQTSSEAVVELQITDAHGKTLLSRMVDVAKGVNTISISDLNAESGIYFVKLIGADGNVKVVRHQIF